MRMGWMRRRRTPAIAVLLLLGAGCGGGAPGGRPVEAELETVEVGPAVGADLSTELDEQAELETPTIAGVLPSDFPEDLPLYAPSSLIDFGTAESGRRFVEFDTPTACPEVSGRLAPELAAAGWRRVGTEDGTTAELHKGERQVALRLLERPPGCGIHIEYRR